MQNSIGPGTPRAQQTPTPIPATAASVPAAQVDTTAAAPLIIHVPQAMTRDCFPLSLSVVTDVLMLYLTIPNMRRLQQEYPELHVALEAKLQGAFSDMQGFMQLSCVLNPEVASMFMNALPHQLEAREARDEVLSRALEGLQLIEARIRQSKGPSLRILTTNLNKDLTEGLKKLDAGDHWPDPDHFEIEIQDITGLLLRNTGHLWVRPLWELMVRTEGAVAPVQYEQIREIQLCPWGRLEEQDEILREALALVATNYLQTEEPARRAAPCCTIS